MSKKKLFLDSEDNIPGYYILGIVSSTSHLEIVHSLNKSGFFNLNRDIDLEYFSNETSHFFISFSFEEREFESNIRLIKNRGTGGIIGKELKGFDYILVIHSENEESLKLSSEIFKNQKYVQACVEIKSNNFSERTKKILGI